MAATRCAPPLRPHSISIQHFQMSNHLPFQVQQLSFGDRCTPLLMRGRRGCTRGFLALRNDEIYAGAEEGYTQALQFCRHSALHGLLGSVHLAVERCQLSFLGLIRLLLSRRRGGALVERLKDGHHLGRGRRAIDLSLFQSLTFCVPTHFMRTLVLHHLRYAKVNGFMLRLETQRKRLTLRILASNILFCEAIFVTHRSPSCQTVIVAGSITDGA